MSRYSYDEDWFENATDEELDEEREKVRQDLLVSGSMSDEDAEEVYDTLYNFDRELSSRAWGDEEPHAPSYHTEHGWYLPEDD